MIKRLLDVAASAAGLLVLSPLFLLLPPLIRLTSPGPAFFKQERVGRGGRVFRILKFRTMVADAPRADIGITPQGDRRVTRLGAVLRATKLDEIPQLWNVLVGDMSLVGPRPEVPKFVRMFQADYDEILRLRPGLTDLASIKYRSESDLLGVAADPEELYVRSILPDKIRLAKEYARRSSLWFDLEIILRTCWRVLLN